VAKEIAAELRRAQPERQGVQFVIAEGMKVDADAQLLRVVLDNFLRNAWKVRRGASHAAMSKPAPSS